MKHLVIRRELGWGPWIVDNAHPAWPSHLAGNINDGYKWTANAYIPHAKFETLAELERVLIQIN